MATKQRWAEPGEQELVRPGSVLTPGAVSKSMLRAMECETYFAWHYLLRDSPFRLIDSPLAQTGTDFHTWRAAYIEHLVEEARPADPPWGQQWLAGAVVTDDARALIADDIGTYGIDPEAVFGTELFLSMDAEGRPLEMLRGRVAPGTVTEDPRGVASGSLDVLELRGSVALVTDYKSGWATAGVSDFEPPVYAALVFSHFPQVERVDFRWEFARLRSVKDFRYERAMLPELLDMVLQGLRRAADIAGRFAAKPAGLKVNPWAGLCGFCALRCPLRAVTSQIVLPPIQTVEDARIVAGLLFAARQVAERATAALKPWLTEAGSIPLGGDFVAELATQYVTKKPLLPALEVLGFDVSSMQGNSPLYDVPLDSLTVGGLTGFAKAKKRAGLAAKLGAISKRSVKSLVQIKRASPGSELLAGGEEDAA